MRRLGLIAAVGVGIAAVVAGSAFPHAATPAAPTLTSVVGGADGHITAKWTPSADTTGFAFIAFWVADHAKCTDQAGGSTTPNNCMLSASNGNENVAVSTTSHVSQDIYDAGTTHWVQVCYFAYGVGYYCSNVLSTTIPNKTTTTTSTTPTPTPGALPTIKLATLPPANGSLACTVARTLLQKLNADAAKTNAEIAKHAKLAKSKLAQLEAAAKKAQKLLNQSAALARQACAQTAAAARDYGEVPADNGTAACRAARNHVIYVNGELRKAYGNRDFTNKADPSKAVRIDQIEKRIKQLKDDLAKSVPAAKLACAKK